MCGSNNEESVVDPSKQPKITRPMWTGHPSRDSTSSGAIQAEAVESRSLDYSHFISLPLAIHSELVEKLTVFQKSVLGTPKVNLSDLRIDQSIFINPNTFHLTVLMLKLWNNERVHAAAEVLKNISSRVNDALGGQPVTIRMKGLDCLKGSLAKARVVYVPVKEIGGKDHLLRACHVIIDAYTEAGLVMEKDSKQKLKLHATVMNSRHRKRSLESRGKDDSFDASTIFQQYGLYEWGDFQIREAHLSQRFFYDKSGYYRCCASIPFPQN